VRATAGEPRDDGLRESITLTEDHMVAIQAEAKVPLRRENRTSRAGRHRRTSARRGASRAFRSACTSAATKDEFERPTNSSRVPDSSATGAPVACGTEHEAESQARTQRNLTCASLDESLTLDAASADHHRATEEAMNELRTHRETHGC
jgi:hypothetical protein